MPRVRVADGIHLPYVAQGERSGVPLLLVHAIGESWRSWSRVLPLLPDSIRAYAVTMRGHAGADAPPDGYSVGDGVRDLVAFLDVVGVAQAVVAGTSSGGLVAQRLAVDHPSRVAGLALVGAPRTLRGVSVPSWVTGASVLTDPVPEDFVRDSLESFWSGQPIPPDFVDALVQDGCRAPAHVWRAVLVGLLAEPAPTEAGRITVPTVVLWGERDEVLARADQEAMAAAIPGARLVTYPDTGHLVLFERPDDVARELARLIAGRAAGGRGLPRSGRVSP